MNLSIDTRILVAYQYWCGERVVIDDRAESIIEEAKIIMYSCSTKKSARDAFVSAGWSDTKQKAKDFVDLIWPIKRDMPSKISTITE